MPLSGTICCRTGKPARFNDCIQCSLTGKPEPCIHPPHLLVAMKDNEGSRADAGLSVTTLLGCHRRAQLAASHEYYEDPAVMEARFKGTLVHEGMERLLGEQDGVIVEKRFARNAWIGDSAESSVQHTQAITGKMDMVLLDYEGGARIVDFKSAGRRSLHPDMVPTQAHVEQVNVYRWILEDGYEVEHTELHPGDEEGYGRLTYQAPVNIKVGSAAILYIGDTGMQEVEIPLWPLEMTEQFVADKVNEYASMKLSPILPDRVIRKRSTANQAKIVWGDEDDLIEDDPTPPVQVLPHWMCTNCALFDICRSLPKEGVSWNDDSD